MATTRRRLRPEQRRELILDSALAAFSQRGYHAASIDEIARGAGTTKAVVYDHVASKRELYDAVVRRELQALLAATAAVPRDGSAEERLGAVLEVFFSHVRARPHARRVMFESIDAEPDVGRRHRANQSVATAAIRTQLMEEPDLLAGAPDRERALEMVAQMFKTAMNGLADWWFDHPEVPLEEVVERSRTFLLGAVGAFRSG